MSPRGWPALLAVMLVAPAAASPLRLSAADDESRHALTVGTVLRVDLDANYSTGYEWQRRDAFGDVLESVPCEGIRREPLVTPGEPAPPVGTGSTASYCFRAAAPGRAFLYLFYGRAWDAEGIPFANFRLDVTVAPAD
jgi:predicted secreted protein